MNSTSTHLKVLRVNTTFSNVIFLVFNLQPGSVANMRRDGFTQMNDECAWSATEIPYCVTAKWTNTVYEILPLHLDFRLLQPQRRRTPDHYLIQPQTYSEE